MKGAKVQLTTTTWVVRCLATTIGTSRHPILSSTAIGGMAVVAVAASSDVVLLMKSARAIATCKVTVSVMVASRSSLSMISSSSRCDRVEVVKASVVVLQAATVVDVINHDPATSLRPVTPSEWTNWSTTSMVAMASGGSELHARFSQAKWRDRGACSLLRPKQCYLLTLPVFDGSLLLRLVSPTNSNYVVYDR